MTAPTQYNGKPIPPGTWLAHAAEGVGEQGESVTDPTPDTSTKMIEATIYDLHFQASNHETGDDADWTHAVADLLAAVTAERDQARQMLADAPHESWCASNDWGNDLHPDDAPPCDCWKSEATE